MWFCSCTLVLSMMRSLVDLEEWASFDLDGNPSGHGSRHAHCKICAAAADGSQCTHDHRSIVSGVRSLSCLKTIHNFNSHFFRFANRINMTYDMARACLIIIFLLSCFSSPLSMTSSLQPPFSCPSFFCLPLPLPTVAQLHQVSYEASLL